MGFAEFPHLDRTLCPYTGGCVYSSPRIGDSLKQNVPFEIDSPTTMLVHGLGKGHEALQTVENELGIRRHISDTMVLCGRHVSRSLMPT